jgi:hypothetical protein
MPRVWSRLSLLVLALFIQLGVARAARCATPVGARPVSAASLPVVALESCVDRWTPASSASRGENGPEAEGAPSDDANSLEQDSSLDDACDTECALSALLSIQQASGSPQRLNAGAGVGACHAVLDAPFKPPRA